MAKAVLISIQPDWCEKIASGRKTIELRKTTPKMQTPFKVYIYCTKTDNPISLCTQNSHDYTCGKAFRYSGGGEVIGEFVCDSILMHCEMANADIAEMQSLVRREKIFQYAGEKEVFGWHISDLVIYDKPIELSEFMKPCDSDLYCEVCAMFREFEDRCGNKSLMLYRAPQSWCYVEELKGGDEE